MKSRLRGAFSNDFGLARCHLWQNRQDGDFDLTRYLRLFKVL